MLTGILLYSAESDGLFIGITLNQYVINLLSWVAPRVISRSTNTKIMLVLLLLGIENIFLSASVALH